MAGDVVIIGVGMTTAVGLSSRQTATSVRAGVARFLQLPLRNRAREPFVVACLPDDALPELKPEVAGEPDLTWREGRLLQLAQPALDEALQPLGSWPTPIPVALGLSEMETGLALKADKVLQLLPVQCDPRIDPGGSKAVRRGRAAALFALQEAAAWLQSGKAPVVLAGGVDTYKDLHVLGTLDRDGRLDTAETPEGFIPGEGAGFLALATTETAQRLKLPPLARVLGVHTGFEEGHLGSETPYKGEGLAKVFQELFSQAGSPPPVREVYSSMNGESYWAKEWGVGYIRNGKGFDSGFRLTHPADCYGDPGAACGALLAGLAAVNFQKGLAGSPALVYSSSDFGDRAALLLAKPDNGRN